MGNIEIINSIQQQIDAISPIIERINYMKPLPKRPTYGISSVSQKPEYDKVTIKLLEEEIKKWQLNSKAILAAYFRGESEHKKAFESTIVDSHGLYYDAKEELLCEINNGRMTLSAIIQEESVKNEIESKLDKKNNKNKTPMVFISHSSKDKDFAEALVVLLEDLGMDSTNVFCSSVDGYGVRLSQDIFETLRNLFNEHNLFVIFIHSPRYYNSPVSLNEMGAAWVLKTDFCSFLTTDMDFGMMKGVVNGSNISIKVDNDDTPARLSELKEKLTSVFGLSTIDGIKWERKRQTFLDKVISFKYEVPSEETAEQTVEFSSEELQIFSKWANNPVDNTYMAVSTRFGLDVHFGYQNSITIQQGRPMAEFEDFMSRLQAKGYIVLTKKEKDVPYYKLTRQGYDFAEKLK